MDTPYDKTLPIKPKNMTNRELVRQIRRLYRNGPSAIRAHLRTLDAWHDHLALGDEDLLEERSREWRALHQEATDRDVAWKPRKSMLVVPMKSCPLCREPTSTPINKHGDCFACAKGRADR